MCTTRPLETTRLILPLLMTLPMVACAEEDFADTTGGDWEVSERAELLDADAPQGRDVDDVDMPADAEHDHDPVDQADDHLSEDMPQTEDGADPPVPRCIDTTATGWEPSSDEPGRDLHALVQDTVRLDSVFEGAFQTATHFDWAIIKAPSASESRLTPSGRVASPQLRLDAPGEYVLELRARDERSGLRSCQPSRVMFHAALAQGLFVSLTWRAAEDAPRESMPDVDLYVSRDEGNWHDYASVSEDSAHLEWGEPGIRDDPFFTSEQGARGDLEYMTLAHPEEEEWYYIAVRHDGDIAQEGVLATVRLYADGELIAEERDRLLKGPETFWTVGHLVWSSRAYIANGSIHDSAHEGW